MSLPARLQHYVDELGTLDKMSRTLLLLDYAAMLGDFPESEKTDANLVRGCVSRVWLTSDVSGGTMQYAASAEGQIAQGMVAMLVHGLSGETPEAVLAVSPAFIRTSGLAESLTPGRQGGLAAMLARMQAAAHAALTHA
jgi:cysteine desulfuration protein SufE